MHLHTGIDPVSRLSVDSPEFRKRAPRVELSSDPDTATLQTAREMCRQIKQAAGDPLVQRYARNAVERFRGGPLYIGRILSMSNPRMQAESVWWWCKHALKFRHHGDMFEVWSGQLGDPSTKLQLLIAPDVLVRMKRMEGDCAIYTMMVCAMLEALGITWQVCPAAVDHRQPEIFSHVFGRAVFSDGTFESLDASHGPYPGWQVPQRDMLRLWVIDANGNRISDQRGGFGGLHDYRRRGMGRRGMGAQVCDDSGCYDDGTGTALPGTDFNPPPFNSVPGDYYNPTQVFGKNLDWGVAPDPRTGGIPVPSQNSAQWAQFAATLAKSGLSLAQQQALKPGMVILPNGTLLQQNPGYAVPAPGALSASVGGSNILLYAGLGIGAMILASMFKGRS